MLLLVVSFAFPLDPSSSSDLAAGVRLPVPDLSLACFALCLACSAARYGGALRLGPSSPVKNISVFLSPSFSPSSRSGGTATGTPRPPASVRPLPVPATVGLRPLSRLPSPAVRASLSLLAPDVAVDAAREALHAAGTRSGNPSTGCVGPLRVRRTAVGGPQRSGSPRHRPTPPQVWSPGGAGTGLAAPPLLGLLLLSLSSLTALLAAVAPLPCVVASSSSPACGSGPCLALPAACCLFFPSSAAAQHLVCRICRHLDHPLLLLLVCPVPPPPDPPFTQVNEDAAACATSPLQGQASALPPVDACSISL